MKFNSIKSSECYVHFRNALDNGLYISDHVR